MLPLPSTGSVSALIFCAIVAIALVLCSALASAQGLRLVTRVHDDGITDYELSPRIVFAVRSTRTQDSPEIRQRSGLQNPVADDRRAAADPARQELGEEAPILIFSMLLIRYQPIRVI